MVKKTSIDQINFKINGRDGWAAWDEVVNLVDEDHYRCNTLTPLARKIATKLVTLLEWKGIKTRICGEKKNIEIKFATKPYAACCHQVCWKYAKGKYARATKYLFIVSNEFYDMTTIQKKVKFCATILHQLIHLMLLRSDIEGNHKDHGELFMRVAKKLQEAFDDSIDANRIKTPRE